MGVYFFRRELCELHGFLYVIRVFRMTRACFVCFSQKRACRPPFPHSRKIEKILSPVLMNV